MFSVGKAGRAGEIFQDRQAGTLSAGGCESWCTKRGREELPQVRGQGQRPRVPGCDGAERPRGATLHLRSGVGAGRRHPVSEVRAAAGRSYPRSGGCAAQEGLEELSHVEGQERWR